MRSERRADPPHQDPAHRRIYAEIVRSIEAGRYGPGARLPGENELAREFGVSRGTLRQALANLRQDGYLEAIAGRGSFVRLAVPKRHEARRRVVGVIVPSVSRPALLDVLNAIEEELHRRAYSMLVASSGNTAAQEAGRVQRIVAEGVGGLIVYPIDHPDTRIYERLIQEDFPLVLIDRHIVGLSLDAVLPDNLGGAYSVVSHLADRGHRRIAFVSSDNLTTTSVQERLAGYQQALAAHGIEADPSLVFTGLPALPPLAEDHRRVTLENARRIERSLLRRSPRPTAVFALHDRIALSVVEAARACGLRIPEELALVGFDDDPLVQALGVSLTSVAQPREEMGRMAARLVADRIEGRRSEVTRVVLPTRPVLRHSSEAGPAEVARSAPVLALVAAAARPLIRGRARRGAPRSRDARTRSRSATRTTSL